MTKDRLYEYDVSMVLKNFYIRNDQYRFLKELEGQMSENLRVAIDDYMVKKKKEILKVSISKS